MVLSELFNQRTDFDDLVGVEADGRLIQDEDGRIADEGLGEADPLPVALGEIFNQPGVHILDFHQPAYFRNAASPDPACISSSHR